MTIDRPGWVSGCSGEYASRMPVDGSDVSVSAGKVKLTAGPSNHARTGSMSNVASASTVMMT